MLTHGFSMHESKEEIERMLLECYLDKMFEIKHEAMSYFSQCFQKPIVDSPFQDEVNFCFLFLEDNFSFYTPFFSL